MLSVIQEQDFAAIHSLIEMSIRASVAQTEEDAQFLIDDVVLSLDQWKQTGCADLEIKYCVQVKSSDSSSSRTSGICLTCS